MVENVIVHPRGDPVKCIKRLMRAVRAIRRPRRVAAPAAGSVAARSARVRGVRPVRMRVVLRSFSWASPWSRQVFHSGALATRRSMAAGAGGGVLLPHHAIRAWLPPISRRARRGVHDHFREG
jgi:hypothetical protein